MPRPLSPSAYTTDAAQTVVAHLLNDRGLDPDRAVTEAERRSALQERGKIVFVYRKTPAVAIAGSEHLTLHKMAA